MKINRRSNEGQHEIIEDINRLITDETWKWKKLGSLVFSAKKNSEFVFRIILCISI